MSGSRNAPHIGFDESLTVEFKETWNETAMPELCAFANTEGGTLFLGVNARGLVVGHDVSDAMQLEIGNKVRSILHISPQIVVETLGGRSYLAVSVRPSRTPLFLRSVYYHRVGSMSVVASHEEVVGLILHHMGETWDALAANATLADIDETKVRAFVRSALGREPRRTPTAMRETDPLPILLQNLHLMDDGRPTNAAMLLFGKDPQSLYRSARIKILFFRNVNDVVPYPEGVGTLFEQIDTAMKAVETANPPRETFEATPVDTTRPISERTQRSSTPQYAEVALREAITNAVVHRDYTQLGPTVEIKMYPDRIVILNPGRLLPSITIDSLRQDPHISAPRNPLISAVCFMNYVVEAYGTGTTRMIEACRALNLPEPEFSEVGGTFAVTLWKDQIRADVLEQAGLNSRQVEAMLYVKRHGHITNAQYQQLVSGSKRTASNDLQDLVTRGWLTQLGGQRGRGVRYELAQRIGQSEAKHLPK
jgi:ATP-dependent DNA helicase RecG